MKKLLILTISVVLLGCNQPINKNEKKAIASDIKTQQISKTSQVGEMCGGIAGFLCAPGLKCQYNGNYPDASGICIETVVDKNLECPKTKAPVCGLVKREKNGYLNDCEAKRHGAKILYQGLCKFDESVKGNCQASVRAISNCDTFFSGYEFNKEECIKINVVGCDAEIPFTSKKECEKTCKYQN